jgi:hypothetical protein
MSTLSTHYEHNIELLNTWATVCGSTLDAMEIPWCCEVDEHGDSVEFRIEFSEAADPTTQDKWKGAINWATNTMRSFATVGNEKNGDPINGEGTYFDGCYGEWFSLWIAIPREIVNSAFSQGVPVLDYIGFVPNEPLADALNE